eukprot:10779510-Alexandrium_andersonii.AAC.1
MSSRHLRMASLSLGLNGDKGSARSRELATHKAKPTMPSGCREGAPRLPTPSGEGKAAATGCTAGREPQTSRLPRSRVRA